MEEFLLLVNLDFKTQRPGKLHTAPLNFFSMNYASKRRSARSNLIFPANHAFPDEEISIFNGIYGFELCELFHLF